METLSRRPPVADVIYESESMESVRSRKGFIYESNFVRTTMRRDDFMLDEKAEKVYDQEIDQYYRESDGGYPSRTNPQHRHPGKSGRHCSSKIVPFRD